MGDGRRPVEDHRAQWLGHRIFDEPRLLYAIAIVCEIPRKAWIDGLSAIALGEINLNTDSSEKFPGFMQKLQRLKSDRQW